MGNDNSASIKAFLQNQDYKSKITTAAQNKDTGSPHNIFKVLGIEKNEVLFCRFIGYLLNLNHNGSAEKSPMGSFIKNVLHVDHRIDSMAEAELEVVIDDQRRVDIVIRNGNNVYPIEVKIGACDQKAQLYDYYSHYFKDSPDGIIYYLTPTGWDPSEASIKSEDDTRRLQEKNIQKRSFASVKEISQQDDQAPYDIEQWLEEIVDDKHPMVSEDLRPMVRQFKEVIVEMAEQEIILDAILKEFHLDDAKNFDAKSTELKTLVLLMQANGDTNGIIQRKIQKAYLKTHLKCNEDGMKKYEPVDSVADVDPKNADKHTVLYIQDQDTKQTVASICVDTNLYLRCELRDVDMSEEWGHERWVYIRPDGSNKNSKFRLDDCWNIVDGDKKNSGKIDIRGRLAEIAKKNKKKGM